MKNIRRNTIAIVVVLWFGLALFYVGTDGFRAFTAEAARVIQLVQDKPSFPDVTLEDSNGRSYSFSEFDNKYVLITFMYTSCPTVCVQLEENMAEIYAQIPKPYLGRDIVFLSISFDPKRDDPVTLNRYKRYFESDGDTWVMARIPNQTELDALLKRFGIIVIPDEDGTFAHNSAFYLVDKQGDLVDVMNYRKPQAAAKKVIQVLLEQGKGE